MCWWYTYLHNRCPHVLPRLACKSLVVYIWTGLDIKFDWIRQNTLALLTHVNFEDWYYVPHVKTRPE